MIQIASAFGLPPSVVFFSAEEIESRQMLSAILAVCKMYVSEDEIYAALEQLKNHPDDLEHSHEGQPDAAASREELPSVQSQTTVGSRS